MYFTVVEWFADTEVFGIYTLVIEIILPWEVIFQIKLQILEGNKISLRGHCEFSGLDLFPIKKFPDSGTCFTNFRFVN